MRHQELHNTEAFEIVDLAELWPDRAAELGIQAEVKVRPPRQTCLLLRAA